MCGHVHGQEDTFVLYTPNICVYVWVCMSVRRERERERKKETASASSANRFASFNEVVTCVSKYVCM